MPDWFDFWSSRLDHFVSSFSTHKIERLNMNKEIHVSINAPNDYFWLTVEVNGVKRRIYHIPFIQKLDSKYDASHEISYDSGVKRKIILNKNYHQSIRNFFFFFFFFFFVKDLVLLLMGW